MIAVMATAGSSTTLGLVRRVTFSVGSVFLTLFGLLVVTFILGRIMPIDPAIAILGDQASAQEIAALRAQLGLDQPILAQFFIYMSNVLRGDLGMSAVTARPVSKDLLSVFPATMEIAILGAMIAAGIGVPLGVAGAAKQNSPTDSLIRVLSVAGYSMPRYWLALILLLILSVNLNIAPGPGRIGVEFIGQIKPVTGFLLIDTLLAGNVSAFVSACWHAALPAITLGYTAMAPIARMTRAFLIDQLSREYILTARIKGLSERRVLWTHALSNALPSILTVIALTFGVMLEGSVLIETIFAWPGLGKYVVDSLFAADLNGVLGGTLIIGFVFVMLNLAADALGQRLDPRRR